MMICETWFAWIKSKLFFEATLSNFKLWSSTVSETFNNYSTVRANNTDNTIICRVFCCEFICYFLRIHQAALVNFMLFLNILKISIISMWKFSKINWRSLTLWPFATLKSYYKALRIAQCKRHGKVTIKFWFLDFNYFTVLLESWKSDQN